MVRIRLLSAPPAELSLILGDVVHNLRASLDYATCALVEFGNPLADLRRTQFAFGSVGYPLKSDDKVAITWAFFVISAIGQPLQRLRFESSRAVFHQLRAFQIPRPSPERTAAYRGRSP